MSTKQVPNTKKMTEVFFEARGVQTPEAGSLKILGQS
jgi:hypothetical protein